MRKLFMVALLAVCVMTPAVADPSAEKGVTAVLEMQAEAWNRGDLVRFMSGYQESPDICYTSGGALVVGYQALQERYQKKYGTDKSTMGHLRFSDLKITDLGTRNALCIGQWHLDRDKQAPLDGVFSLVLTKGKEGWKIIHDHTSVRPSP